MVNQLISSLHIKKVISLLAGLVVLILVAGCAGGSYATFDRDRDLDNRYLNYEVLEEHNYYTTGGYDAPDAILALHSDYELINTNNLWIWVPNVNSAQMRKWIDTIAPEQNYRRSNAYFAAYILAPDGKRVGAWYAIEPYTTVKFLEDNKVQVYPPFEDFNIQMQKDLRQGGVL